jgi:anti-anti-sigma factor
MYAGISPLTEAGTGTMKIPWKRDDGAREERKTKALAAARALHDDGLDIFLRPRGPATVVSLVGSVDHRTSPRLGRRLRSLVKHGERLLLVDMGCVERIDSSAIATLIDCLHHLWRRGGQMAVFGARPRVRAWFEIFMLDGVLRLCAGEEEAAAACSPSGTDSRRGTGVRC